MEIIRLGALSSRREIDEQWNNGAGALLENVAFGDSMK